MNNFQIFNQSLNNALTDSQYTNSQDRINGVLSELAKSTVHNKLFAQVSVAAYALAKFVSDHGRNALDRDPNGFANNIALVVLDLINNVVSDRVPNTRASATTYKKGDVVESPYIPKWGELECITAGTSASTDVINGVTINAIGQQINDGTVVWAIRAKRFHTLLNVPVPFRGNWSTPILIGEPSYPIHPEIGLPMWDCRLCDGTNGTIDMRNRFLMASDRANANQTGGKDTISIQRNHLPTGDFALNLTMQKAKVEFKKNNLETEIAGGSHNHSETGATALVGEGNLGVKAISGQSGTLTGPANINHKHKFNLDLSAEHNHDISGKVVLNTTNQQTISNVSQHYKMTFIQRIY